LIVFRRCHGQNFQTIPEGKYTTQWAKDNFALVMMSSVRRYRTLSKFVDYLEGLQSNEKFRRWAARQYVRSA
jgi:hypothetical protein